MRILDYTPEFAEQWNSLVANSRNGTFLHSRSYLDSQGDKFRDTSLVVLKDGTLVGVLPAAADHGTNSLVTSHPGATYGSLVRGSQMSGLEILRAWQEALTFLRQKGFSLLVVREIPAAYHKQPCEEDGYFLEVLGGKRIQTSLSSVLRLDLPRQISSRKKRNLRKAANKVVVTWGNLRDASEFHSVLTRNLRLRYGKDPVHGQDQLINLWKMFPNNLALALALSKDNLEVCAGVLIFKTDTCWHAQYIASTAEGRSFGASDYCLEFAIENACKDGVMHFSFGISNDPLTGDLNDGLYTSKAEFGAGGLVQSVWEVPCN